MSVQYSPSARSVSLLFCKDLSAVAKVDFYFTGVTVVVAYGCTTIPNFPPCILIQHRLLIKYSLDIKVSNRI